MMPSEEVFTREAQKLGINKTSKIIIYDNLGIYSSPRAWWMFRAMGHKSVAVLDGGLPEWKTHGLAVEAKQITSMPAGNFEAQLQLNCFKNAGYVLDRINSSETLLVDARSNGRFRGVEPEPREGLRGGHIPNSVNMPFGDVLEGPKMLPAERLKSMFDELGTQDQELVFSCGSGLTACIPLLAAEIAGREKLSVYDGSWSEWGKSQEWPIEQY